jgi:mannosyltransferase OCH1-like enzyme
MIPKIIHFCWLSNDPYPSKIKNCIKSWQKHLPEYEIIHWNFSNFDINQSQYVKEAFYSGKYPFAADYIRLYALYTYGGIYLDSDVEVLKSYNDLLHLPYFIGREDTPYGIEAATIGASKGLAWIKLCLSHYDDKKFIQPDGYFDLTPLPSIMKDTIEQKFTIIDIKNIDEFIFDNDIVSILPVEYFSPKHWNDKNINNTTSNTYSIHHFTESWKKEKKSFFSVQSMKKNIHSTRNKLIGKTTSLKIFFARFLKK